VLALVCCQQDQGHLLALGLAAAAVDVLGQVDPAVQVCWAVLGSVVSLLAAQLQMAL
jgi:hypothetical protein